MVSEESGAIRIAERGKLSERLTAEELRAELEARLTRSLNRPVPAQPPHEEMAHEEMAHEESAEEASDRGEAAQPRHSAEA